jgi:hypothetical protein
LVAFLDRGELAKQRMEREAGRKEDQSGRDDKLKEGGYGVRKK